MTELEQLLTRYNDAHISQYGTTWASVEAGGDGWIEVHFWGEDSHSVCLAQSITLAMGMIIHLGEFLGV